MTAVARLTADAARARRTQKDRPPLRVVERPVRQPRDRRLLALVGGALLFAGVLAGNVAVHAQTTQGQFELERLSATARQRQVHYQQLRLQVAQLEAPQRIVGRAKQMGMVEPSGVTYLTPSAKTSTAPVRSQASDAPSSSNDQAAQGWGQVKPHLDERR